MTQSEWGNDTVRRIAKAIRAARGKRSAQWVANRTAELGHPISREAIANLEVGRKASIDITDLVILARALEVAPIMLIYPDLMDGPVEVIPGQQVTSFAAQKWFAGEWAPNVEAGSVKPPPGNEDSQLPEHENWRYLGSVEPVTIARSYDLERSRLRAAKELAGRSDDLGIADFLADRQQRVAELRRVLEAQGMVVEDE